MPRRPLALVCLALLLALPARADDGPIVLERARRLLGLDALPGRPDAGLAPVQDEEPPRTPPSVFGEANLPFPRIRLEAYYRVLGPLRTRVKIGRNFIASSWEGFHDAHVPRNATLGWRVVLDARVHDKVAIGVHYTRYGYEAPSRHLHHAGIGLQATRFPGGSQAHSSVDVQVGEVFARYVIKDTPRVRLAVGLGAAWASLRVRLVDEELGLSASGRVETFFAPTISYWFSIKLADAASFFFESLSGLIAPWRFPSMISEFRIGLRWHLTQRLELVTAASWSGGLISDTDDLWGGKHTLGHRWQRAEWTAIGGDFGLAFTF